MKRLLSLILLLAFACSCASLTGRTAGEIVDDSSITTVLLTSKLLRSQN